MKKILLLLTIFSMVFTSCEPLEDINEEVDAQANPIVGDVIFALTDDDYDALNLNYGSFSSLDDAKAALPNFLSKKYPVWGKGSSALINYNLYVGNAFSVKNYTLNQADYTTSGSDLLGFESTASPADYLVDIITNKYATANEGDFTSAMYDQYTGSAFTVTPEVSLDENLDYGTAAGDLTTVSSGSWVNHSGASNQLMYSTENLTMANYPSSNVGGSFAISTSGSEDVNHAISPELTSKKVYSSALIKLSEVGNGTYFFHLMEEDGSYNFSARTGAKSDGNGKVLFGIGASSSSLTYGTTAYDLDTTYLIVTSYEVETGISNLYVLTATTDAEPASPEATNTGNSGNSAKRIGIRQGGGGPSAIIDGIRVANTWSSIMSNDQLDDETVGNKETYSAIYTYANGAWVSPSTSGVYSLSDADFASIGVDNFGSSKPAGDYLPTFLNIKFPYAKDGDVLSVLYKYVSSSSGAQTRGDSFTKSNGVWVGHKSTITSDLQFGHDGSSWVPDNTIKYTLVRNDDYAYMASQLTGAEYAGFIGNLASYGDFDYNWSTTQIEFALIKFLEHHDPSAADGQKYVLTYVIYDNGENDYNTSFIKTNGAWVVNK